MYYSLNNLSLLLNFRHFFKPGGIDLSRSRLSISTLAESRSRQSKKDSLNENLDAAKSRLKSIDFKNLNREKKNCWSRLLRKS